MKFFGAAGMLIYVVLSTTAAFTITGPSTHPTRELFPFFTWSLFSRIVDVRKEYHLSVFTLDGQTFHPPVDMRRLDAFPQFSDSRSLRHKALQNLGNAVENDDGDSATQRQRFAARFFGRHSVDYTISRHEYNPLERWRAGPLRESVEIVGRFSYEGGS